MKAREEKKLLRPRVSPQQKIALMLFGLFLFFVLLETGLRLGGFVLLSIQEHGNLQSLKQKGTYRILCLGESTTQNQYPPYLEEILNKRNVGVRFSVVDKGESATKTPTILSHVESYLAEYHPNMVVAMMGINDWGGHIPFEAATTSKGVLFIRSFRTYKLARLLWLHILTKAKETGFYKPNEDRRSSWKVPTYLPGAGLKEASTESVLTEDSFKKAIELDPENGDAYVELGRFYRGQGKFSQAGDSLKKAIEFDPKNGNAYAELGLFYKEQGQFSHAEDSFKKAIELDPRNGIAYAELGRFYRGQGKFSQAEDFLKKAIELDPKNYVAYDKLGWLYQGLGKLSQAEECFKKATELEPENDDAYVELGRFYRWLGKFSEAEDSFKKAIELNPKNDRILGVMSSLYEEIGKPELAKEYAQKMNTARMSYYSPITVSSYRKLKKILDGKGIKLVCVQYPVRNVEPLKKIFEKDEGIIFVDNARVFKEALKKSSYKEYFTDMFGGEFGHCTQKGNSLLAQNIADVILREVFHKHLD